MMTLRPQVDVVHLSSAHPWTDNRIHYRECNSLAAAGYGVRLIAVETDVPGSVGPVAVRTVRELPRLRRVLISSVRVVVLGLRTKARVFHLHDPELVWSIPLLRLIGKKVLYDAHEDLPAQVESKPYLSRASKPFFMAAAHLIVRVACSSTHIIAATETIAKRYPAHKTTVVHNYPPLTDAELGASKSRDRAHETVYIGGISEQRGAEVMVAAAGNPAFPPGWQLTLAGELSMNLKEALSSDPGWKNTEYLGQLPPEDARRLLLRARVGVVLFQDTVAHRDSLPTKMFEYFAAGLPVIASDFPLWRSIVGDNECGILVDQSSPSAVAAAIGVYHDRPDLLEMHSANARRMAVEKLNWETEASSLVAVYDRIFGFS